MWCFSNYLREHTQAPWKAFSLCFASHRLATVESKYIQSLACFRSSRHNAGGETHPIKASLSRHLPYLCTGYIKGEIWERVPMSLSRSHMSDIMLLRKIRILKVTIKNMRKDISSMSKSKNMQMPNKYLERRKN